MGVRQRKPRQEGEGLPATGTAAAADTNPIVMLVVCLLAAVSMADDRILLTNGASPQNDPRQLAAQSISSLCDGAESGIKRIVPYRSSAPGVDPPRSEPEAELLPS